MFEHLAKFEKILVTGPQRSGTTICAKMIAVDTGHKFLSEAHLEGGDIEHQQKRFGQILKRNSGDIVIQCPTLSRWVHWWGDREDVLIIFMLRDIEEIQRSEKRIGWDGAKQLSYYRQPEWFDYHQKLSGPISAIKYKFWEDAQKSVILNWLEIEFESLSGHPLWVPKFRRRNFSARQISEDNRFAGEIFLNG